jgi:hypothetical protein
MLTPRTIGKCGCRGGCVFFGNNRNGPPFFEPSDQDFINGTNSAIHHICIEENSFGFAQSLLQRDQFMFDLCGSMPTPGRTKMANRAAAAGVYMSKDNTLTRTITPDESAFSSKTSTLVDRHGSASDRSSFINDDSHLDLSGERTLTDDHRLPLVQETVFRSSVPSDSLPDGSMPDAYDTDRYASTPSEAASWSNAGASGSFSSLPEMLSRRNRGHERQHSFDPPRIQAMQNGTPTIPRPGSLSSCRGKDSKTSLPSSTGTGEMLGLRNSTLTSPVLRRLSSQVSVPHDGSSISIVSSDRYFSADEERSEISSAKRSDSVTSTESGASFISAVSSQHESQPELFKAEPLACPTEGEETVNEDYETEVEDVKYRENIVDLHGQMNHQITRSPLLIGCYMSHMTKLKCSYWSAPPPLPSHQQVQGSPSSDSANHPLSPDASLAPSWIPEFAYINEGFTPRLMVTKPDIRSPPDLSSEENSEAKKQRQFFADSDDDTPSTGKLPIYLLQHALVKFSDFSFCGTVFEILKRFFYLKFFLCLVASSHSFCACLL